MVSKLLFAAYAVLLVLYNVGHTESSLSTRENLEQLDDEGKVWLSWSVNEDTEEITFDLEALTLGYVGFGISPQGSMTGADIFIAGVLPDGTPYYSDRYGTGFEEPEIDAQQDWTLLNATENPSVGKTYLRFSRKLNTCDEQDYPIGADTNRLIWAMGETDTIEYHTSDRRGTRSVNLLGAPLPDVDLDEMEQWHVTLNHTMPAEETAYWCSFHKGPELDRIHHIVGFEAFLPDENALKHTHHFILYNCYEIPESNKTMDEVIGPITVDNGYNGNYCYPPYDPENPFTPMKFCKEYIFVWAKGGKRMVFPENVGYPIGTQPETQSYYMLEIHYDNPDELQDVHFETGVTVYHTEEIREMDAAILLVSHDANPGQVVPPDTDEMVIVGHCSPECSQKFPTEGVNVFNVLLHSHLSGRKLLLRHFRDGTELPWLAYDFHFDFDYQQNMHLGQEVKIFPGDHLTFECTYSSTWKNGKVVLGGLSTEDEMCESFLWYYPAMNVDICGSTYPILQGFEDLGITNVTATEVEHGFAPWYILEPQELEGLYEDSLSYKYNWTDEGKKEFEQMRRYNLHESICLNRKEGYIPTDEMIQYPEIDQPYQPIDQCA